MSVVVSKQTSEQLTRFMAFFGIDEYNRPLFRRAVEACGVEAFERFIGAMDTVIQLDGRFGCATRMRESIEKQRKEGGRK